MKILFVDIDTLRPDHMSCYGYGRQTTPNIDQIAAEGVRFDQYFCSDAPCLPSRAALISGMFGIRNGAVGHGGTAADMRIYGANRAFQNPMDENNFTNIFRKAGMHTVSFSSFAERHSSFWFNAGFHEMYNVGKGGMESAHEVVPTALDWLERNRNKDNWFMHLHVWDPHTPYRTPEDFDAPFSCDDQPLWIDDTVFEQHLKALGPHTLRNLNMYDNKSDDEFPKYPGSIQSYDELKQLFYQYDCGIRYCDEQLGLVFEKLKQMGIYEDTAIIITSDHGENMGELGIYAEHGTADYPTCHIPMIIKWPNANQGVTHNGMHYNLDIVPTMAELLGVEASEQWDGNSYAKALFEQNISGRDSIVISQMAHVCQRSAIFDNWLYIRTYHDGMHFFDKEMLFDLKNDPYEQNDVKNQHPDICAKGAKIILDWQDELLLKSEGNTDPMWQVLAEGGPFHAKGDFNSYIKLLENDKDTDGANKMRCRIRKDK